MEKLICPISSEKIDRNVVRTTGFMMVIMIMLYVLTGQILFIVAIFLDYFIRAFTSLSYSPFSWLAKQIVFSMHWQGEKIDKAPKIFAARVGWLFSLAAIGLYFINPLSSIIVALILMGFALLESVFNFCVGCVVYTYIVVPIFRD